MNKGIGGLIVLLLFCGSALGSDWYVDDDGPGGDGTSPATAFVTVQAGINAAGSGDTIHVAAGFYIESLTLKSGIHIVGVDPTRAVVDASTANGGSPAAHVGSGSSISNVTLENLTLRGGEAGTGDGGGLYLSNVSNCTITNCFIRHNDAARGGGIFATNCGIDLVGCTITQNTADTQGGGLCFLGTNWAATLDECVVRGNYSASIGGGIYAELSSEASTGCSLSLTDSTVSANVGQTSGGGIYSYNYTPAYAMAGTLTDCTLSFNAASTTSGGGLYSYDASWTIDDSVILDNYAGTGGTGGGLSLRNGSHILRNVLFGGNVGEGQGGAVAFHTPVSASATNCTFVGNQGYTGGGAVYSKGAPAVSNCIFVRNLDQAVYEGDTGDPVLNNNLFYNNEDGDVYDNDTASALSGDAQVNGLGHATANVFSDPLFLDSTADGGLLSTSNSARTFKLGDYHLASGSPAIDAGDNSASNLPTADMDGATRIQNDVVDIGIYEYGGAKSASASAEAEKEVKSGGAVLRVDVNTPAAPGSQDGTTWATAYDTIVAAIAAADPGDEIWVAQGTYTGGGGAVEPTDYVSLYGGFAGTESTLEGRDVAANETIITTTVRATETFGSRVDGFTVTGISFTPIRYAFTDVETTIANCTVINNSGSSGGGGIGFGHSLNYYTPSEGTVENCLIVGNHSTQVGGGLRVTLLRAATNAVRVRNCTFAGNSADGGGSAIAIYNQSDAAKFAADYWWQDQPGVEIEDCIIAGNTTTLAGAVLASRAPNVQLVNTVLSGNSGNYPVWITEYSGGSILNCTIADNTASGGASALNAVNILAINSIFAGNDSYYAIYTFIYLGVYPTLAYCLLDGHSGGDYYRSSATYTGAAQVMANIPETSNLLDGAPLFVMDGAAAVTGAWSAPAPTYDGVTNRTTLTDDTAPFTPGALVGEIINPNTGQYLQAVVVANTASTVEVVGDFSSLVSVGSAYVVADYRLQWASPAVDAGDNDAPGLPDADADGGARVRYDRVDLGPYEFGVEVPASVTVDPVDTVVLAGDDAHFFATAVGDAPLTHQWYHDGNPVAGTLDELVVYTAQVSDEGEYWLYVENPGGSDTSAHATLTVLGGGDRDGDGITDFLEGYGDPDSDGTPNYLDDDSDGDGIPDATEGTDDTDTDGTPNFLDDDSDGDGISDATEGTDDPDTDGTPNYLDDDSDGDTIPDVIEGAGDPDSDSIPNSLDLDSDDDGIPDATEGTDDTDTDGTPNFLDDDSDGDSISDATEGTDDPDTDGTPNYLDDDSDGDGIPDAWEGAIDWLDMDGIPNYLDDDSDGDGIPDATEGMGDPDSDYVWNFVDDDSDGDGISDATEGTDDPDTDGTPNYLDDDSDGDGIPDATEGVGNPDSDYLPNYLDNDSDNDGVSDYYENIAGTDPYDANSKPVVYVDVNAAGGADGTSWADAFTHIQDGVDSAAAVGVSEVWVAEGRYDTSANADCIVAFENGVHLYGGFAGSETERTERDWTTHETIIDANGKYHGVFIYSSGSTDIVLDGFTVTGGNADGATFPHEYGGGIFCYCLGHSTKPIIRNCTITQNNAKTAGGGAFIYGDTYHMPVTFNNVIISDNSAKYGAGLALNATSITATNCRITGNVASAGGGGAFMCESSATFTECLIARNRASSGGGVARDDFNYGTIRFIDCAISGNRARGVGGGFLIRGRGWESTNCRIEGNYAQAGGGIYADHVGTSVFKNCTITQNYASTAEGGAVATQEWSSSSLVFTNCTVAENRAALAGGVVLRTMCSAAFANCTISGNEGGGLLTTGEWGLTGYLSRCDYCLFYENGPYDYRDYDPDPFFGGTRTYAGDAIPGSTANLVAAPVYVGADWADFRLQAASNALDLANAGDAPNIDQIGVPRPQGSADDIGAFEFPVEALDSDGDTLPDVYEGDGDPDEDSTPNNLDDDSDGDGLTDLIEGIGDVDYDGLPAFLDLDSDGDGIADSVEGVGAKEGVPPDTDGDGIANFLDTDSDADGLPDAYEGTADPDTDGLGSYIDPDSDNDGTDDVDEDEDGDGIANGVESYEDPDLDGIPNFLDGDADDDGTPDAEEGAGDEDEDGIPDYVDDDIDYDPAATLPQTDSDEDGIPDGEEPEGDADGDGIPNIFDTDSDDDGIPDGVERNLGSDPYDVEHPTVLPVRAWLLLIVLGAMGVLMLISSVRQTKQHGM